MNNIIERLKNPEHYYPSNFDTPARANAVLLSLCQEAAELLEDQPEEDLYDLAVRADNEGQP